jgi:superoxide dismutase, Cu-Zn family
MIIRFASAAVTLLALSVAAASAQQMAKATLKDASGKEVGRASLTQGSTGVTMQVELTGVPPGDHAFHIHTTGTCQPPFTSAGGHFNPANKKHGKEASDGAHAGDMDNITVPADGKISKLVVNNQVTLDKDKPNSLFKPDGTALVVHAKADDYKSDPAGNAGDRIACGVIEPGS